MGVLIGDEAWNVGLEEVVENLEDAIERYDCFLAYYGTTPNMKKVDALRSIINRIKKEDFKNKEVD